MTRVVGQADPWGNVREFKFDHTNKWYMHKTAPVLENDTYKLLSDFDIQTDHLIPARGPDLMIIKKRDFAKLWTSLFRLTTEKKLKECEKMDKYFDLARESKKLWNMKVTIVLIAIDAFGTVTKGLLKGLEDLDFKERVETIQTTALLRRARILRRVLETCCYSNSSERPMWKTLKE